MIVNTGRYGSHALIVQADSEQVRIVNLPNMSVGAAVDHANAMLAVLAGAYDSKRALRDRETDRNAILNVLDWLWEAIAEPVLTELGYTSQPKAGDPWPHVWCAPPAP